MDDEKVFNAQAISLSHILKALHLDPSSLSIGLEVIHSCIEQIFINFILCAR